MKKNYVKPESKAIEIRVNHLLAGSPDTSIGGDATEPALSREMEWDE